MASKFSPPTEFDFSQPNRWEDWKNRFLRFRLATKLNKENGEIQVSSLIYAMGMEAENIMKSFGLTPDQSKNFDEVIKRFNDHFIPRSNVIHERAKFNQRKQQSGESAEQFIRSLYEISENCDFGTAKNDRIRDAIVIGILDKELSEKMQLKDDLTLENASTMARQSELVKSQVRDQTQPTTVNEVRGARARPRQPTAGPKPRSQPQGGLRPMQKSTVKQQRNISTQCTRCNRRHGNQGQCPAMGQTCKKCNKLNHFAVCCKTKQVHEIAQNVGSIQNEELNSAYFLESCEIDCDQTENKPWIVNLEICKSTIAFKIDSGADISIISESCYKTLKQRPALRKALSILKSPGGNVNCLGYFIADIYRNQQKFLFRIYVVAGKDQANLLSRGASSALKLVKRIDEIPETVFGRTGRINCEPVKIELKSDAQPYSVSTARRIPFPLLPKVKEELENMVRDGILTEISEPTDWCSPMVPVLKPNGNVRICVDYKKLNESIKRELYMLPNLDDIAPKLAGMTVFSKLDGSQGFHQLPLNPESSKLTTFITPFGRYAYQKVPMGTSLGPEIFQKKITELLQGLENVNAIMDGIIVYGRDMTEHDAMLTAVLQRINEAGLKLNKDKCLFRQAQLEYFGHVKNSSGISPNPKKVEAIRNLEPPKDKTELRRVMGMINYLGRYVENLSTIISPMSDLLKDDTAFYWGPDKNSAFEKVKSLLTEAPTLTFYKRNNPIVVSADSSRVGLGAAIYMQEGKEFKPIAFASRTLTESEKKWAQIELECLSLVYACEKFSRYLIGLESFKLITDHKPLIPLINKTDIDKAPIRCQRLLLRLRRFNCTAQYSKGTSKDMIVSDCLSRSPLQLIDCKIENEVNLYVDSVSAHMPISDTRLKMIYDATQNDSEIQQVISLTRKGWPETGKNLSGSICEYFSARNEFSVVDGLLLYRNSLVIPISQRMEVLEKLHMSHQGLTKSKDFAAQCVWWPTINKDLTEKVQNCKFCQEYRPTQRREPLKPSELPTGPWVKVAADLCQLNNKTYLVVMDTYSKYIEIGYLNTLTSERVVDKMKNMFSRWGDPEEITCDGGPQFIARCFKDFAKEHNIKVTYSSAYFPQANGAAEAGVKIAKNILKQKDSYSALRTYLCTPTVATSYSPSELMIGRQMRIHVPCATEKLRPKWPSHELVKKYHDKSKENQAFFFNRRHAAQSLPILAAGDKVRIKLDSEKQWQKEGTVLNGDTENRTYTVKTNDGTYRRNRVHLQKIPAQDNQENMEQNNDLESSQELDTGQHGNKTRCGRQIKPPQRYAEFY